MSSPTIARRVRVTGRVQGVFFRAWTKEQAEALGISGWVRNCPDGSVEAHVEGDETAVTHLICMLGVGPPNACVDVIRQDDAPPQSFERFDVRH